MKNLLRKVDTALPLAVVLTGDDGVIHECRHDGEVYALECTQFDNLNESLNLLTIAMEEFTNVGESPDPVALDLIEYTGHELLGGPGLESDESDDSPGFIKRAMAAVVKFFINLGKWIKAKLTKVLGIIAQRFTTKQTDLDAILSDLESGKIQAITMKVPPNPSREVERLKDIASSFSTIAVTLPKDGDVEDALSSWELENETQSAAVAEALTYFTGSEKAGKPDNNLADVLVDAEYIRNLIQYYEALQEVMSSAHDLLVRSAAAGIELSPDQGSSIDRAISTQLIKSAQIAFNIVNKLMTTNKSTVDQVIILLRK